MLAGGTGRIVRRHVARGFLAVAPDLLHRTGTGAGTLDYGQHAEAMPLIEALGPGAVVTDVHAVLEHVGAQESVGLARTAVIGFCFGGRAAFTTATATPGLGAVVAFYGPGIAAGPHAVLDRAPAITAPVALHVGSDDPVIPADQIDAIDHALSSAGTTYEQHRYPGAGHAFACDPTCARTCTSPRRHKPLGPRRTPFSTATYLRCRKNADGVHGRAVGPVRRAGFRR